MDSYLTSEKNTLKKGKNLFKRQRRRIFILNAIIISFKKNSQCTSTKDYRSLKNNFLLDELTFQN